ncbi:MAG: hypothetical protein EPN93_17320 [Spirochaetes bacterium]|nr:MAG: hypothetical protein EPN93_17320 [Spirochaetota bacterium]
MRQKPEVAKVASIEDANEVLRDIALCQLELAKIDTPAAEDIKLIQARAEQDGRPYRERIEKLEALLVPYAEANKDDLFPEEKNARRSLAVTFGSFGYRRSTSINIEDEAKTIEAIEISKKNLARKLGIDDAIVREPKIQKTKLRKFSDDILAKFGITRIAEDTFFYETDIDAVNIDLQKAKSA